MKSWIALAGFLKYYVFIGCLNKKKKIDSMSFLSFDDTEIISDTQLHAVYLNLLRTLCLSFRIIYSTFCFRERSYYLLSTDSDD